MLIIIMILSWRTSGICEIKCPKDTYCCGINQCCNKDSSA